MQWKVLAGLRFFLAWIVVCYHLKDFTPDYGKDFLCTFGKLNGLAAVLGFLLISGYSIAHSITRNPEGFYKRRFLRIYPLYFCAVFVSLIPFLILGQNIKILNWEIVQPDLWAVVGNLMFFQTFISDNIQSNTPLWSLSVEAFCYILAPFFIRESNKKILIYLAVFSCLLYIVLPCVYYIFFPSLKVPFYSNLRYGLPFALFVWVWLLGFLYFSNKEKKSAKMMLVGLGSLVLLLNPTPTGKTGIVTYLFSSLVLIYSPYVQLPKPLLNIFNYLGDISYPLYLFHIPTFIFSSSVLGIKDSISLVFLALLVSMLFYHAIDTPLRLRKSAFSTNVKQLLLDRLRQS